MNKTVSKALAPKPLSKEEISPNEATLPANKASQPPNATTSTASDKLNTMAPNENIDFNIFFE